MTVIELLLIMTMLILVIVMIFSRLFQKTNTFMVNSLELHRVTESVLKDLYSRYETVNNLLKTSLKDLKASIDEALVSHEPVVPEEPCPSLFDDLLGCMTEEQRVSAMKLLKSFYKDVDGDEITSEKSCNTCQTCVRF